MLFKERSEVDCLGRVEDVLGFVLFVVSKAKNLYRTLNIQGKIKYYIAN